MLTLLAVMTVILFVTLLIAKPNVLWPMTVAYAVTAILMVSFCIWNAR